MVQPTFKRSLQAVSSLLAVCWLIYGYYVYFSRPSRATLEEILEHGASLLTTSGILDVAIVLALWAASDFLGDRVLRALGMGFNRGAERVAFASAAGLAVLSLATTALTAANLLYRAAVGILVAVPALLWLWQRKSTFLRTLRTNELQAGSPQTSSATCQTSIGLASRTEPTRDGGTAETLCQRIAHGFLLVFVGTALAITLVSALAPPLEFDDLAYHLTSGKTYIQKHRFQALPQNPVTFMPKNVEMLYTLGMLLHNEVTAKLIHYLMGVLAMLATYALGVRLFSRNAGLAAMAILASSPLFLWEMRTVHIDVGLALYIFLSVYATVLWLKTEETGWPRLIVCFLGFGLGIKYHALFAVASLSLLVFLNWAILHKRPRKGLKAGFTILLIPAIGLLIPWGAINLYFTGNPVFPMLHDFFDSRYWTPELTEVVLGQQQEAGIPLSPENWTRLLTLPWQLFVTPTLFKGNLGPFFLLLAPFLFLQRRIGLELKLLLGFSLFYFLCWIATAQHARYLLPVLPGLALVLGWGLTGWLTLLRGRRLSRMFAGAVSILLALMAVLNLPLFKGDSEYGTSIRHTFPLQYLLGLESREAYLTRHIGNYPIIQFLNQLPGPKRMVFWWSSPAFYYLDGEASYIFSPVGPKLVTDDPKELYKALKENGITHVIAAQEGQNVHLLTRPEGEFVRNHLKRIYQKAATVLYEFSERPLHQETVHYDFLGHIQEATIRMPAEPAGKPNAAYRMVAGTEGDPRYSLVAFPPAEVEFNLTLCDRPVLQFAVGQAIPNCSGKGVFEIWLVKANGASQQIYSRALYAEKNPSDVGWFEERLELSDFARQKVKILFKTQRLEGGPCTWYCWGDPVMLSRPADSRSIQQEAVRPRAISTPSM